MRTQADIQRAHDLFVPILTREIPVKLDDNTLDLICATTHVLCWILEHNHKAADDPNRVDFGEFVRMVEEAIKEQGFALEDHGN